MRASPVRGQSSSRPRQRDGSRLRPVVERPPCKQCEQRVGARDRGQHERGALRRLPPQAPDRSRDGVARMDREREPHRPLALGTIAREQLGADEDGADAEHPPRVQRRALRRPDPPCLERGHEEPHHAVDDANRREGDTGSVAETGLGGATRRRGGHGMIVVRRHRSSEEGERRGPGFGLPPADTGSWMLDRVNAVLLVFLHLERRLAPFFRRPFDALLRDPLTALTTKLINWKRRRERDDTLALAEERLQPHEEALVQEIIDAFAEQLRGLWKPGHFERGGNTKTHGVVRATLTIRDDLPENLKRGIFAEPRTYRAWVRFSGPGPYVTPDIDDVGFMSMSIKIMGVTGPKLLEDERFTQDLMSVSPPTFVTPDTRANAQLQHW